MASQSRKATLLRLLGDLGNYRGIECYRTPGEDVAVAIACKLIERTSLKDLDGIAQLVKSKPFWNKQW